MDIIDLARQLGVQIQNTQAYKDYAAAKINNDNDEELQKDIGEFNLVRLSLDKYLSQESNDKEKDKEKVKELNMQMKDIYSKIMSSESMVKFNIAKKQVDTIVNQINTIISLAVSGEDPLTCDLNSGCTGQCSGCSGCH